MVSRGRWHTAIEIWAFSEADLRPLSLLYRAGGDRTSSSPGLLHSRGWALPRSGGSTISRGLRRNAATRSGGLEYRATTAQWHADRAARRPKRAKLATNTELQRYVQERLAGAIIAPSGATVPRPVVTWKGRRHGRRQ